MPQIRSRFPAHRIHGSINGFTSHSFKWDSHHECEHSKYHLDFYHLDFIMSGSTATKGVEGDQVALGDRFSPRQSWCRFCGSTVISQDIQEVLDMICQECFKSLTESSSQKFLDDMLIPARLTGQEFDKLSQTIGEKVAPHFQEFAEYAEDLARRTLPTPDSPLSPYLATQDLTLDELTQVMKRLLPDSLFDTVRQESTGNPRGPTPVAVFYDELP